MYMMVEADVSLDVAVQDRCPVNRLGILMLDEHVCPQRQKVPEYLLGLAEVVLAHFRLLGNDGVRNEMAARLAQISE